MPEKEENTTPITLESHIKKLIGSYELLGEISHGGMGVVYKALHRESGEHVAIKCLIPLKETPTQNLRYILREGRIGSGLSHPSIVSVIDYDIEGDAPYVVMEYIEGSPLSSLIYNHFSEFCLDILYLTRIFCEIVDGVRYAHAQGVLHCDLKSANILIDSKGHPKILDFGIARFLGDTSNLTEKSEFLATPAYMAPERVFSKISDVRSDIYSLGVIFYEMLSGRLPFEGNSTGELISKLLHAPLISPKMYRKEVPSELEAIVLKMLARDPSARYQSCPDILKDLRSFLEYNIANLKNKTIGNSLSHYLDSILLAFMKFAKNSGKSFIFIIFILMVSFFILKNIDVDNNAKVSKKEKNAGYDKDKDSNLLLKRGEILIKEGRREEGLLTILQANNLTQDKDSLLKMIADAKSIPVEFMLCTEPGEVEASLFYTDQVSLRINPKPAYTFKTPYKIKLLEGSYLLSLNLKGYIPVRLPICVKKQQNQSSINFKMLESSHALSGMVLIPEGEFVFGGRDLFADAHPKINLYVPSYLIDEYEVTEGEYEKFIKAMNYLPPPHWKDGNAPSGCLDHPVTNVSFDDAMAYASWAGKTLPSEVQWEKAARGVDGRVYPWGNELYTTDQLMSIKEKDGTKDVGKTSYDVSPYGVYDMGGNVSEWTTTPVDNTQNEDYVIRGGAWAYNPCFGFFKCMSRAKSNRKARYPYLGFRCVKVLQ